MSSGNGGRKGILDSINHPLAFYGLVVLVVESVIAAAAALKFNDEKLLFWLFIVLIFVLVLVVGTVSFIAVRYPHHLMAKFDDVANQVIRDMSPFHRETLLQMGQEGKLDYTLDTRNKYKDLRNRGLARTLNRKAMKNDTTLVLTELGSIVVEALKKRGTSPSG